MLETGIIHLQQEATTSGGRNGVAQRPAHEDRHDNIEADLLGS